MHFCVRKWVMLSWHAYYSTPSTCCVLSSFFSLCVRCLLLERYYLFQKLISNQVSSPSRGFPQLSQHRHFSSLKKSSQKKLDFKKLYCLFWQLKFQGLVGCFGCVVGPFAHCKVSLQSFLELLILLFVWKNQQMLHKTIVYKQCVGFLVGLQTQCNHLLNSFQV